MIILQKKEKTHKIFRVVRSIDLRPLCDDFINIFLILIQEKRSTTHSKSKSKNGFGSTSCSEFGKRSLFMWRSCSIYWSMRWFSFVIGGFQSGNNLPSTVYESSLIGRIGPKMLGARSWMYWPSRIAGWYWRAVTHAHAWAPLSRDGWIQRNQLWITASGMVTHMHACAQDPI